MALGAALRASLCTDFFGCPRHLASHDPRRDGDDTKPQDHDDRGDCLAKRCVGRYVSVPHSRHRDDCPIDTARNTGEAIGLALDEVHHRSEDDGERDDRQKKDDDFAAARTERPHHDISFANKAYQFEYTKHPEYAEYTDHDEKLCAGEQQAQICRSDGQ